MKNRGISLRRMDILMVVIAVLISGGLFFAMNITNGINEDSSAYTQQLIEWRESSYDLQIASDYLTEQMQDFTITADRTFLDNYFTEAKVTRRRENALQVLGQGHARSAAYRDLSAAMDESVSLMEMEYYAAKLTVIGNGSDISQYPEEIRNITLKASDEQLSQEEMKEKARAVMHGEEYRKSKDVISSHMTACLEKLDEEMKEKQRENTEKLNNQVLIEHILTIALIVVLLVIVFMNYFLVMRPLKDSEEMVRDETDIPVRGASEIRFLIKTYNLSHQKNLLKNDKQAYVENHDRLTGLYNKNAFDFLIKNADPETSAVLLLDIDNLSKINEKYGRETGDRILKKVSKAVSGLFRRKDYVCRLDGDNLAVIIPDVDTSISSLIEEKVNNINSILKQEKDDDPQVSVCAGASFGEKGISFDAMLNRADKCLSTAKKDKNKCVAFYDPTEDTK